MKYIVAFLGIGVLFFFLWLKPSSLEEEKSSQEETSSSQATLSPSFSSPSQSFFIEALFEGSYASQYQYQDTKGALKIDYKIRLGAHISKEKPLYFYGRIENISDSLNNQNQELLKFIGRRFIISYEEKSIPQNYKIEWPLTEQGSSIASLVYMLKIPWPLMRSSLWEEKGFDTSSFKVKCKDIQNQTLCDIFAQDIGYQKEGKINISFGQNIFDSLSVEDESNVSINNLNAYAKSSLKMKVIPYSPTILKTASFSYDFTSPLTQEEIKDPWDDYSYEKFLGQWEHPSFENFYSQDLPQLVDYIKEKPHIAKQLALKITPKTPLPVLHFIGTALARSQNYDSIGLIIENTNYDSHIIHHFAPHASFSQKLSESSFEWLLRTATLAPEKDSRKTAWLSLCGALENAGTLEFENYYPKLNLALKDFGEDFYISCLGNIGVKAEKELINIFEKTKTKAEVLQAFSKCQTTSCIQILETQALEDEERLSCIAYRILENQEKLEHLLPKLQKKWAHNLKEAPACMTELQKVHKNP